MMAYFANPWSILAVPYAVAIVGLGVTLVQSRKGVNHTTRGSVGFVLYWVTIAFTIVFKTIALYVEMQGWYAAMIYLSLLLLLSSASFLTVDRLKRSSLEYKVDMVGDYAFFTVAFLLVYICLHPMMM